MFCFEQSRAALPAPVGGLLLSAFNSIPFDLESINHRWCENNCRGSFFEGGFIKYNVSRQKSIRMLLLGSLL